MSSGRYAFSNSIISGNTSLDVVVTISSSDLSFNLIGWPANRRSSAQSDLLGVIDPILGALQDNSGFTATRAPLAASPALDHSYNLVMLLSVSPRRRLMSAASRVRWTCLFYQRDRRRE